MEDFEVLAGLRKEYEALSDEQLIELAGQGKDDYREGAYELIMAEVAHRGLSDKIAAASAGADADREGCDSDPADEGSCGGQPCAGTCAAKPDDELVPFMIFLGEGDVAGVTAALDGAGITYCSDALHLRGKEYPRLCMVPRGMAAEAMRICGGMQVKNSVTLW